MLIIEETSNYTSAAQNQGNGVKKAAGNNDSDGSKTLSTFGVVEAYGFSEQ